MPSMHRVQLAGGPAVWAMCAIDLLGIPQMAAIATPRSSPQTHGCRRLPSADKMVASHLTPRQGGCHGALLDYRGRCADADAG